MSRDARLDGTFVYAVRSTGIYCRPSCPSRRPARDRVLFFAAPEAAEKRGFRPCLRCRPRVARGAADAGWIGRVCRFIEAQAGEPVQLSALAAEMQIPPLRLQRMFRRVLGISPRRYGDTIRLRRFKERLQQGDDVTTALYEAGYGSASRLYERSNDQLGMTPATYRRGGRGMEIGYTLVPSALGLLLVAGTGRGLSAVYLGDASAPLEAALRREYPAAQIRRNPAAVSRWVGRLVRHLAGAQPQLSIPLDVQATAFQRRVWDALQAIPYGETRSYGDISRALGRPKAARAVARACASNPAAVLIPCHRVLREDGKLGGYRWGIGRKQALLEQEKGPRKNHGGAVRRKMPRPSGKKIVSSEA
jgi:AraC family transcriptional regulator, regulatory protein of adaptative response / methylated-DNA-[protein]-cysteine methyltransferase